MKKEIPVEQSHKLISPGPVCLLTAYHRGRINILTAGWIMPASHRPFMVAVSIFQGNFTHDLVQKSGEFVLNIPSADLARQVQYCASISGADVDKLKVTGLHEDGARFVRPPLIEECIGHLECTVAERFTPGDHSIFVAEVVAAKVEGEAYDNGWLLKERDLRPLHHLGGDKYAVLEPFTERRPRDKAEQEEADESEARRRERER